MFAQSSVESRDATRCNATTVFPVPGPPLTTAPPGCCCQGTSEAGRHKTPPFRATTARSADGSAEPLWQLAEQLLLVFTDPRHVAVRPQQRRGHVQFPAFVDDVVDPI